MMLGAGGKTAPSRGDAQERGPWPRWLRLSMVGMLVVVLVPTSASGENGNIGTNQIEVLNDGNLYPQPATGCSGNAFNQTVTGFDWVKDCLQNLTLTVGQNAAAQKGHWNGFRVLDGIGGADQDIFLTGGKENDHETWNPGPGSVGSSKYDITQAYLANNDDNAYFGMERRGNNGTTAFDWEFNKYAPDPNGPFPDYVPNRSEGDVLLTFEMKGAGNSGSATPFRFVYDDPDITGDPNNPPDGVAADTDFDGVYVSVGIDGINAVINNDTIPSAPWGAVSSQGAWTTDALERFKFAEARVPLTLLGIEEGAVCEEISRFVQVRTRASSTENSDLKDLTKIFSFDFFAPTNPTQTLEARCDAEFDFSSSLATGDAPGWTFSIDDVGGQPAGVTLAGVEKNGSTVTLSPDANGTDGDGVTTWTTSAFSGRIQATLPSGMDSVTIDVSQSAQDGGCDVGSSGSVTIYRGITVSALITTDCDATFDWSTSVTGGKAPYDITVKVQRLENANWVTKATLTFLDDADGVLNTAASTSDDLNPYDATGVPGSYRLRVDASDSQDPACTGFVESATAQVRDTLTAGAAKDVANINRADLTVAMDGSQTGALAGDTVTWQWQKRVDSESPDDWFNISTASTQEFDYGGFESDDITPLNVDVSVADGAASGSYKGRVWVVQLRVKVTRTVAGLECVAYSSPVTVKMVKMVDP